MTDEEFNALFGKALDGDEPMADAVKRYQEAQSAPAQADERPKKGPPSPQKVAQNLTQDVLEEQQAAADEFDPDTYVNQGPEAPVERQPSMRTPGQLTDEEVAAGKAAFKAHPVGRAVGDVRKGGLQQLLLDQPLADIARATPGRMAQIPGALQSGYEFATETAPKAAKSAGQALIDKLKKSRIQEIFEE